MKKNKLIFFLIFLSIIIFQISGADLENYDPEKPEDMISAAAILYENGKYDECMTLLDQLIADYELHKLEISKKKFAVVYYQRALITYAFREEGYAEEIEAFFLKAVELNISLEIEKPASTPPYILERFISIRQEYLNKFSRTTRRNNLGIFGALVLEPTIFSDPNLLQPGIHYSFNLNEQISLGIDFRFPLEIPIWNSIRGQAGVTIYPIYSIESFFTGYSVYYMFALDELSRYTHSLSFSAQLEYIYRSGIGFAFSAEVFRLDLFWDSEGDEDRPNYGSLDLIGNLLRLSFANMSFFVYYTF